MYKLINSLPNNYVQKEKERSNVKLVVTCSNLTVGAVDGTATTYTDIIHRFEHKILRCPQKPAIGRNGM